jgi:flagellar biosynthesis protein FlhB
MVEIEHETPAKRYQAVAEVISDVMRLERGLGGGTKDL